MGAKRGTEGDVCKKRICPQNSVFIEIVSMPGASCPGGTECCMQIAERSLFKCSDKISEVNSLVPVKPCFKK